MMDILSPICIQENGWKGAAGGRLAGFRVDAFEDAALPGNKLRRMRQA